MTTTAEQLHGFKADEVVDARGTSCPGPILAVKKGIAGLNAGQIMEVLSSDAGTLTDLPAWCKKTGHELLGVIEDAGYWRLFVKKVG